MFFNMDYLDRPKACPIVEGSLPLRWSVGYYRNKKRIVFAWFFDFSDAQVYLDRMRKSYPQFKIDLLKSLL